MTIQPQIEVGPASTTHQHEILQLLRTAERAHFHLDWQSTEGWLDHNEHLVAWASGIPIGLLAIPIETASDVWLRLAAVRDDMSDTMTMTPLWSEARAKLQHQGIKGAAALTANIWPESLLPDWGFIQCGHVVMLRREQIALPTITKPAIRIRTATSTDLQAIFCVDQAAFKPPWRYSLGMLGLALRQSAYATVAYEDSNIVGYLLATYTNRRVFLARLVVAPHFQHRGVGRTLALDMLHNFAQGRTSVVEVNTQKDNVPSITLYKTLDFKLTDGQAQVWHCDLN